MLSDEVLWVWIKERQRWEILSNTMLRDLETGPPAVDPTRNRMYALWNRRHTRCFGEGTLAHCLRFKTLFFTSRRVAIEPV